MHVYFICLLCHKRKFNPKLGIQSRLLVLVLPACPIIQGNLHAATSSSKIHSMMSAQMANGTGNSPNDSHSGYDRMGSVTWQALEPLCNSNTSSPSFEATQRQHRSSKLAPHGASSHSSSMPCIGSTPEMPQHMVQHQQQHPPGQGAPGFSHTLGIPRAPVSFSKGQVLPGSGSPAMQNQNWPAGAGMVSPSTCTPMTIPPPPARRAMGPQGCRTACTPVYHQRPGMLPQHQHQPGRIPAPTGSGPYMQHPFRGNTPLTSAKGLQHSQGGAGSRSDLTPVSSAVSSAADPSSTPAPRFLGPWGEVSLEVGLKQLWSAEELAGSKGGRLYNVQQLAWHLEGDLEFTAQDMYNFQKLKRMVQVRGVNARLLGFWGYLRCGWLYNIQQLA